ncbi:uncharacterized protein NECHADRAFT_78445 [Fusarium vanettenii 77-13-4]|uniref:Uncharacterized protein n=1 Tax=Fusarium vanettenii (strain ATCC MYA-4622 / CBS 123669 / FGSC 9596 / NRRL 45880 / 77-13-4) TaxID=660122 RepID=C7ZFQ4_FUSV7|nr:uncharacterized protein NECHADRAFT_78445 [Fusarium vanettenii 77-13-4]EEU37211.1 hypothetical protein NECHADRAFT_78445 [Fusarium vanettenii 77-13-4]
MDYTCEDSLYNGSDGAAIFGRSTSRWRTILSKAKAANTIPSSSLDLTQCLDRIPCLPEKIPSDVRLLKGFSTWSDLSSTCSVKDRKEREQRLFLTKPHPTVCSISDSSNFRVWEGKKNNGIALLTLGWAYTMGASLAERQDLSMEYLPLPETSTQLASTGLNLEYASPDEQRWWKAITTSGRGWTVSGSKLSPWATVVQDLDVSIAGDPESNQRPPTAREAAHYLSRFCEAYDLGSQCSAALAAALTIPLHASINCFKPVKIQLPKPSFTTYYGLTGSLQHLPAEFDLIGYYMTLSICPWVLGPSLWSVFWSPDVPCNRAGAWMQPISDMLEPIIQNNDMELLARVMSFSPMSPLWLGLAICGRRAIIGCILPSLTKLHSYPFSHPFIDAAVWTGMAQSFLDFGLSGPSADGMVSRADVWRMRHDFSHLYPHEAFSHTPPYGWPPFGSMRPEDIELEIRDHLACSHQWKYSHWTWSDSGETDTGLFSRGMRVHHSDQDFATAEGEGDLEIRDVGAALEISRTATEATF